MNIAFIPTNVSGVVFYRTFQPYEALKKYASIVPTIWWYRPDQFDLHPWENQLDDSEVGPTIYRDLDLACQWADVVVWMVMHHPKSFHLMKYLKAKHDKFFITEVDDYLFSIPEGNIASRAYRPGEAVLKIGLEQLKFSDAVICSTPYLRELYSDLNKNIGVVENAIDLGLWRGASSPRRVGRPLTIGWVGGATHEDDLEIIKKPLLSILEKNKDVKFKCIHGVPAWMKTHKQIDYTVKFKPIDKYPAWIKKQGFDIGVAPLVDNNFNRGKSNLRWLEYSALGIPCVASPLPHFNSSIQEGVNGFIASTDEEWETKLQRLIDDDSLRKNIGMAAHNDIENKWSTKQLGRKYRLAVQELLNAKFKPFHVNNPDSRSN